MFKRRDEEDLVSLFLLSFPLLFISFILFVVSFPSVTFIFYFFVFLKRSFPPRFSQVPAGKTNATEYTVWSFRRKYFTAIIISDSPPEEMPSVGPAVGQTRNRAKFLTPWKITLINRKLPTDIKEEICGQNGPSWNHSGPISHNGVSKGLPSPWNDWFMNRLTRIPLLGETYTPKTSPRINSSQPLTVLSQAVI